MLIKVSPVGAEILLKNARVLLAAASLKTFTTASLANAVGLPVRSARFFVEKMRKCELAEKVGRSYVFTGKMVDECFVLNFRDRLLNVFFKRRATGDILLGLASGFKMSHIARSLHVSRITVLRVVEDLTAAGILSNGKIAQESIYQPADPLEEVPRKIHREALCDLKHRFESYTKANIPLILFGEALRGSPYATLKLAALLRPQNPEADAQVTLALARSINETASDYKVIMKPVIVTEDVWYAQKFGLIATPHSLLLELSSGIFVHGKQPKDEDYFELIRTHYQPSYKQIKKWLGKGYLQPYGNGFMFTEKGLKAWRKKPIAVAVEEFPTNGERIPIIYAKRLTD